MLTKDELGKLAKENPDELLEAAKKEMGTGETGSKETSSALCLLAITKLLIEVKGTLETLPSNIAKELKEK